MKDIKPNLKPTLIACALCSVSSLSFASVDNLTVAGFPDYVSHGTITDNQANIAVDTQVDSVFKYAGFGGNGDPCQILAYDELPLHDTIINAQNISNVSGKEVLPVMVVYTANGSGGMGYIGASGECTDGSGTLQDLQNDEALYKHYATFITQAVAAQDYSDGQSTPMSFILNPDFLGEFQKYWDQDSLKEEGSVHVNTQLTQAIDYIRTTYPNVTIPSQPIFENNIIGYIASINFIMELFAPNISYGWQMNIWAGDSALWLQADNDLSQEKADIVNDFLKELKVYNGDYKPDYIVFDKWERDGFDQVQTIDLLHAANATNWDRYLKYVEYISSDAQVPAMLWQISAGHMPTKDEGSTLISENQQSSSGPYFMGDSRIGTDISIIDSSLLNKPMDASYYYGNSSNVEQFLSADIHDWSEPMINTLPSHNIFAILWGGGSTTSVSPISTNSGDGDWMADKIEQYSHDPVKLDGTGGGDGGDNLPPEVSLSTSQDSVDEQGEVTVNSEVNDPDGDNSQVVYNWSVSEGVEFQEIDNGHSIHFIAPEVDEDTNLTVTLEVTDSEGESNRSSMVINVHDLDSGNGDGNSDVDYVYPEGLENYTEGTVVDFGTEGIWQCYGAWAANCSDSTYAPGMAADPTWVEQQWKKLD